MSVEFPTIDPAVYETALSSGNATVQALAPVVRDTHLPAAAELAQTLQAVSKAAETAEADLDNDTETPEAVQYHEAVETQAGNEEKYKARKEAAEAKYKAELQKIEESFASLKEARSKIKELRSAAIRAIASKNVASVDSSATVDAYKKRVAMLKGLEDSLALVIKMDDSLTPEQVEAIRKLVPHLPTATALTSTRKSLASAIKGESGGWRPRFVAAVVDGEAVEQVTSSKGEVSARLQDVAKKIGVHRDNLTLRLESLLGGRTFTDATLDANGFYNFEIEGHTVSVQPKVKNAADNAPAEEEAA